MEEDNNRQMPETKKKGRRIILYILLAIAAILVGAIVSWRVLDAMGKKALYGGDENAAPMLTKNEEASESETAGEAVTEAEPEHWEEGWISYKGKVYEYNKDILTFLFMGIDEEGYLTKKQGFRNGGQADSIFMLVMDPTEKELSIVAVNRNTMTEFDTCDEDGNFNSRGYGQICLAYEYGDGMEISCENEERAVKDLFYSLPICGYVSISMGAIPTINDAVGGVTVPRMTYEDGETVYGDDETLYGMDAYRYVRSRGSEFGASFFRLEKQKIYLKALMNKMLSAVKADPTVIVDLYKAIVPYMVTDIGISKVTYLADNMAGYHFNADINSLSGTTSLGDDGYEEFYYDSDELYDLMIRVFYREVQP